MNILFLYSFLIKIEARQAVASKEIISTEDPNVKKKISPEEHKKGVEPKPSKSRGMFYNTKWDPLLEQPPFNQNYQMVLDISGFYDEHQATGPDDSYGDLNLWTLNLSSAISTEEMNQQSTLTMKQVLDHSHPSIFALQGIRESLMARLKKIMNKHYQMANTDSFTKDSIFATNYYFPIIYDTRMFDIKQTGYIKNLKGVIYASYVVVENKMKKNKKVEKNADKKDIITFINIDLFSTFRGVVEGQFANILSDVKGSQLIRAHPVFFMGGLGALSAQITNLLNSGYKNLIDHDNHNMDLDKTTVHGKVEHSDNVQRDFIITRDPKSVFTLNYARILSGAFPVGEHYPVQAILSYT